MGKLLKQLRQELGDELAKDEANIKAVFVNSVSFAEEFTTRVDVGFMKNNWFFSLTDQVAEEKNEGSISDKSLRSNSNIQSWSLGENAYIVNPTEYVSYHDLGTRYISPLFLSYHIEAYLEKELNRVVKRG